MLCVFLAELRDLAEIDAESNDVVSKARKYLQKHMDLDWNMNMLCRMFDRSPRHLTRLFRAQTGFPPMTYLQQVRMKKVHALLTNSNLTLKEIAADVGLRSGFYLSRLVSRYYGRPPSVLRKS